MLQLSTQCEKSCFAGGQVVRKNLVPDHPIATSTVHPAEEGIRTATTVVAPHDGLNEGQIVRPAALHVGDLADLVLILDRVTE